MKSVLEYLQERKDMASHNLFCYSASYFMDKPKEGYEEKYAEAVRDCEIVDELIALIEVKGTQQCRHCNTPAKTKFRVKRRGIQVNGEWMLFKDFQLFLGEDVFLDGNAVCNKKGEKIGNLINYLNP